MAAFPRLLAQRSVRSSGALGYTGSPQFSRGRRGCNSRAGGAASTTDPGSGEQQPVTGNRVRSRAPGSLPLLSTFPARGGGGRSRAILKGGSAGPAIISRSAQQHRGGSARRRREPEEGHGAAAALLSTGARAAGGTVSASKGRAIRDCPSGASCRALGTPGLWVVRAAAVLGFPAAVHATGSPPISTPFLPTSWAPATSLPSSLAARVL